MIITMEYIMKRFVRSLALAAAVTLAMLPAFQAEAQVSPNYVYQPASYNPVASVPNFLATTTSQNFTLTTSASGLTANEMLVCVYNSGTVGNQPVTATTNNTIYLVLSTSSAQAATVATGSPVNQGCQFFALGTNTNASVITNSGTALVTMSMISASTTLGNSLVEPANSLDPSPCLVASAATVDLGAACFNGSIVNVTGTTTMTSFGATAPVGSFYFIYTVGAAGITYNATTLILHSATSLTGGAGNLLMCYVRTVQGNWTCSNVIN